MNNTKILESYFNLIDNGIVVDIESLPSDISKDVVYKMTLYKELKHLVATKGSQERIDVIKSVLYPPQEEVYYEA